jgi:small conductance mechanosensitive channel
MLDRYRVDGTLAAFLASASYVVLVAFVILAALNQLGVQTTSFIAVLGAAGLAIALAFQGTLSNLSAGVLLIVFRPFRVGDYVEGAGTGGTIEAVELFTTTLHTPDNRTIIVPNSQLLGDVIVNYSVKETRRIDLVIGVSYADDLAKAKEALARIVAEDERVLADPATTIGVLELADSSVNFAVRPWVKAADYWPVRFDLLQRIKAELDAAGISIPFPQRDVHLHTVDEAA